MFLTLWVPELGGLRALLSRYNSEVHPNLYDIVRIGVREDTMTSYYNIIIGYSLRGYRAQIMFNLASVLIWEWVGVEFISGLHVRLSGSVATVLYGPRVFRE